jgi:hypothetical protein
MTLDSITARKMLIFTATPLIKDCEAVKNIKNKKKQLPEKQSQDS